MKEKDLVFDREKHICYSKKMKNIIREHLLLHCTKDELETVWEKIQLQYVKFLEDLPYLGGKKCTHNGPGGTYDCIMLFAYYEVLEPKPSIDELYEMNNIVFLPPFKRLGKIANLNRPSNKKLINKVFEITAKKDAKWHSVSPTSYIMKVEPYDENIGVRYRFDRCPIAEFAKAHGYLDIMPAFCNGDYPAINYLHGTLIRKYTCSNSDHCDYWIVGDKDAKIEEHPLITDEVGYLKNIDK